MMSEQEKPDELIQAEKLVDEGKFEEALSLLKEFEEKRGVSLHNIVLSHLIKCDLLHQYGLNDEALKLAEQTYKESLELGKNYLSIDALIFKAESLIRLSKYDDALEVNKQGEELLKEFTEILTSDYKRREASILFIKGKAGFFKSEGDKAIEYVEQCLGLREKFSPKKEIAVTLSSLAWGLVMFKGDLKRAFKCAERGLAFAKESNNKYELGISFLTFGLLYSVKGDLDRSKLFYENSLTIYKQLYNKRMMATTLNNLIDLYTKAGDLDRALECSKQCLELRYEVGNLREIATVQDLLIQLLIEKGDLEQAQQVLNDLEQLNNQLKDKQVNVWYLFSKALLLKTNSRARNRVKAEEIFKYILEEEDFNLQFTVGALLNLCELLLIELRTIGGIEVLGEIETYVKQLLDIAEKSQSYWILCETHLLQAKLSLLTFDIKKAQRFLTQAQQIAERFNLSHLANKITMEKEDLLSKLDLWDKMKEVGSSMADRFELARLDEQISGMVRNRAVLTAQITEDEVTIHTEKKICLVCRSEVLRFSYICECGAIYCENCARAVIDLENVCWVCDVPIDYSKPVKQFKEEEEIVKVEKNLKRKGV